MRGKHQYLQKVRSESLRRRDDNLGTGVRIKSSVRSSWDGAFKYVRQRKDGGTLLFRRVQRRQGIRGLSRLADRHYEISFRKYRRTIANFARQFCLAHHPCQLFNPMSTCERSMITCPTGNKVNTLYFLGSVWTYA